MKRRQAAATEQAANSGDPLMFAASIRTKAQGIRPRIRTVQEAIGLIDDELPAEIRSLPRWTFARALLVEAHKTRKKRDVGQASRQFRQALENEGWLVSETEHRF